MNTFAPSSSSSARSFLGEQLVRADVVDAPDDAVEVVLLHVLRREVQARRTASTSSRAGASGDRGAARARASPSRCRAGLRPAPRTCGTPASAGVRARCRRRCARARCSGRLGRRSSRGTRSSSGRARARRSTIGEEELMQLQPALDGPFLHPVHSLRSNTRSWVGFPRAPSGSSSTNVNPRANVSRR